MNIGFLRSGASMEEIVEPLAALERSGCDRIVVVNNPTADPRSGVLAAVLSQLSEGDSLITWSFDSVASSTSDLITMIMELDSRKVRFRSVVENFDSHGRHRAGLTATLAHLRDFELKLASRRQNQAEATRSRRVGRPRSLSTESITRARQLLKQGITMDNVAKELHVSRATLYRYLDNGE